MGSEGKVAELEAFVAEMGGEVVRRHDFYGGAWTFRCAKGHEWSRDAPDTIGRRSWCRQCRTDEATRPLEEHVDAMGGEITRRGWLSEKWAFRCAKGHEWERNPTAEASDRRWCRHCRIDAEAEAAAVGDSGPPCMDCWARPTPAWSDFCRSCRSRHRRAETEAGPAPPLCPGRRMRSARPAGCADCGRPTAPGWTRCARCLAGRASAAGRSRLDVGAITRGRAAARYGPCPCGRRIGGGAKLVDPRRGYESGGALARAKSEGWPDGYEAGCPGCWPRCRRCGRRVPRRDIDPAAKVCPGCAPAVRRDAEEAAARRAASRAAEEEGRAARRAALREERRAGRRAGVCSCGRPTRHRNRGTCEVCSGSRSHRARGEVALKVRTMEAYGGRCSSCGCSVLAFLRIDHIDNARPDGAPRHAPPLWSWLEERGWPKDHFRCLCSNCNQAHEYYGYLPADGRPQEWDHAALLARIDPANIAARTRELCARLEALRASEGLDISAFARAHGLGDGTVMAVMRTATGWSPPPDAPRRTVMPRTTMFSAGPLRRMGGALGMRGQLCIECGEEMPVDRFRIADGYEGRSDHLVVSGVSARRTRLRCKQCRRAKRLSVRLAAIRKYGGACRCCGETTYEFLAADHVGGVKPEDWPTHGDALYRRLAAEPLRDDYRVLCHQCNWAYFAYGQRCPHEWTAPGATLAEQAGVNLPVAIAAAGVRAEDKLVLDCLEDMVVANRADAPARGFVVRHERAGGRGVCRAFSCSGNVQVGTLAYAPVPGGGLMVKRFRVDQRHRGRGVGTALAKRFREENQHVPPEAMSWAGTNADVRAFLDAVLRGGVGRPAGAGQRLV